MRKKRAQSTIEFTFAMVAILFLIYGMIMIFRWSGMDLANRRVVQDDNLTQYASGQDPAVQLNGAGVPILPLSDVYHGAVTSGGKN